MERPFLVFGTSALSRLLLELLADRERDLLAGFCVDRAYRVKDRFCGFPVHDFEDLPRDFPATDYDILAPLRYFDMNRDRERLFARIKAAGYRMPGYTHPSCRVAADAVRGENVILLHDNVVRPRARIADNAFIWTRVLLDRGAEIGAHSFISGGTVVRAGARVGRNSFVGPKSVIEAGCTVGEFCVIGAGGLILRDCRDKTIYGPPPARYGAVP
jgi:hypothetical protein